MDAKYSITDFLLFWMQLKIKHLKIDNKMIHYNTFLQM